MPVVMIFGADELPLAFSKESRDDLARLVVDDESLCPFNWLPSESFDSSGILIETRFSLTGLAGVDFAGSVLAGLPTGLTEALTAGWVAGLAGLA